VFGPGVPLEVVGPVVHQIVRDPLRPYPEYSRANSYPWSPFPPEAGPPRTRSSQLRVRDHRQVRATQSCSPYIYYMVYTSIIHQTC